MNFTTKIEEVYKFLEANKNLAYTIDELVTRVPFARNSDQRPKYIRQTVRNALKILVFAKLVKLEQVKSGEASQTYYSFKKKGDPEVAYESFEINRVRQWKSFTDDDVDYLLKRKGLKPPNNGHKQKGDTNG